MAYDPGVVTAINSVLDQLHASPRVRKAAFEAAIVESGVRNLSYGDRDSEGVFQQRPSQGWGTPGQVTDPTYAATQFVKRAITANSTGRYGSAGELAQAVQRSAFPSRYDQQSAAAEAILAKHGVNVPSGSGSSSGSSGSGSSGQPAQPGFQDPGQAGDFTSLLSSLLSKPQQPMAGSVAVAPPSFTATPPVPQGFQAAPSQAPVQPGSQATLQDALGLLGSLGGSSGTTPAPGPSSGSDATGGASDAPSTPAGGKHGSEVLELIHNDGAGKAGFGIKNGEAVNGSQVFSGVWDGHANHVHVAAGRKTVVALGQLAQHMGLTVSENPHFGGVTQGAHVPDSYHYKGEAIDASGSPQQMDAFARAVERYNQTRVLPR